MDERWIWLLGPPGLRALIREQPVRFVMAGPVGVLALYVAAIHCYLEHPE